MMYGVRNKGELAMEINETLYCVVRNGTIVKDLVYHDRFGAMIGDDEEEIKQRLSDIMIGRDSDNEFKIKKVKLVEID